MKYDIILSELADREFSLLLLLLLLLRLKRDLMSGSRKSTVWLRGAVL